MAATTTVQPCAGAQCDHTKIQKLGTDTATITVHTEHATTDFVVYVDLFKRHSGHFAKELASFPAVPAQTLDLPAGLSIEAFEIFLAFTYTGHIYSIDTEKELQEWRILGALWILGDVLSSVTFKDAVVDAVMHKRFTQNKFPQTMHEKLGSHMHGPTGIGKLLVDIAVLESKHGIFNGRPLHHECLRFYGDVIVAVERIRRGTDKEEGIRSRFKRKGNCLYHEHGTSELCYKSMCPATSDVRRPKKELPRLSEIMTEIHKLAIRHSDFLAKALGPGSDWKEANENVVRLPESFPEDFQVFLSFIATGSIHLDTISGNSNKSDDQAEKGIQVIENAGNSSTKKRIKKVSFVGLSPEDGDGPLSEDDLTATSRSKGADNAKSKRGAGTHPEEDTVKKDKEGEDHEIDAWFQIAEAWILGDRLQSRSFKDAVVDKLVSTLRETGETPAAMYAWIYKNSIYKSGMRKLLVDIAVHKWSPGAVGDQPHDPECIDFFKDVAVASMERMERTTTLAFAQDLVKLQGEALAPFEKAYMYCFYHDRGEGCHYHDHNEEKSCYKAMFE